MLLRRQRRLRWLRRHVRVVSGAHYHIRSLPALPTLYGTPVPSLARVSPTSTHPDPTTRAHRRPSFEFTSAMRHCRFEGNRAPESDGDSRGGAASVYYPVPILWGCELGQWASRTGEARGDFVGCSSLCAPGSMGTRSDHEDPTCGAPCDRGHWCPEGTVVPQPCPAGFRMPVVGAVSAAPPPPPLSPLRALDLARTPASSVRHTHALPSSSLHPTGESGQLHPVLAGLVPAE